MNFEDRLAELEELSEDVVPDVNDPDQKAFVDAQVDAVVRARYLLGQRNPMNHYSLETVVGTLAKAERKAEFMCGFVMLSRDKDYLRQLNSYMITTGYLTAEQYENIQLSGKGTAHATKSPLPEPIETVFYSANQ